MKNSFKPELKEINFGFMPLTDCAPIVAAKEMGFFEKWGLNVKLHKQNSWAVLRDKLHSGYFDVAQMLAPMPLVSSLGADCIATKVITPMVLSYNGNAITISESVYQRIVASNKRKQISMPLSAGHLKPLIEDNRIHNRKLKFATVFSYSCHYYQLLSWLQNAGVSDQDVDIVVISPEEMVDALRTGEIDGFCVGGPWNAKAVREGAGLTGVTSADIWPDAPEKVLGMLADWQVKNPETTMALIAALQEACNWMELVPNRFEAARLLTKQQYLNMDLDIVAPSLLGSCLVHESSGPRYVPGYNLFTAPHKYPGNCPELKHGDWIMEQMIQTGHIEKNVVPLGLISSVYRQDIYQAVSDIVFSSGAVAANAQPIRI